MSFLTHLPSLFLSDGGPTSLFRVVEYLLAFQMKYFPRPAYIFCIEVFTIIFYPIHSTENNMYYLLHQIKQLGMHVNCYDCPFF